MPGQLKTFIGSIRRKPAKAPDGKRDSEANGSVTTEKTSIAHDLVHLGLKNTRTVAEAITTLASGEPMNDKELLLEKGVSMLQSLPLNSGLSETVSNNFISMLWHDLPVSFNFSPCTFLEQSCFWSAVQHALLCISPHR